MGLLKKTIKAKHKGSKGSCVFTNAALGHHVNEHAVGSHRMRSHGVAHRIVRT